MYRHWSVCSYCPEIQIVYSNGHHYINVDVRDETLAVRPITAVLESQLIGEFKGWDGQTRYQLVNGQVWQQTAYKYKYAYRPEVIIFDAGNGPTMKVEGTTAKVWRIR